MRSVAVFCLTCLACFVRPIYADENDSIAIMKKGKAATALVVLPGARGFGSAFCIEANGYFVTNEHVVSGLAKAKTVSLVLNSGEDDERVVEATVLRTDKKNDLALLSVAALKNVVPLELGAVDNLTETAQLTAFGYPFGDRLAVRERKYPSVSVNVGRITALRRSKKELETIQLDAQLNPGNSGGPVLDARGRVVGIVVAGVPGSGVNFAIPVSKLQDFIRKPEIAFEPTAISYLRRHDAATFTIKLVSFAKAPLKPIVELTLTTGKSDRKFLAQMGGDGTYSINAAPVPAPEGPRRVPVNLIFPSGRVLGTVSDQVFSIGKDELRLSEVKQITPGASATVISNDSRELTGPLSGLGEVKAQLGDYEVPVDLTKATRIIAEFREEVIDQVGYKIQVKEDDALLAEASGSIILQGHPAIASTTKPARSDTPKIEADKSVIELPSTFEDVWIGDSGRYVILHLKRLNKLAIFDVTAARVIQYIEVPAERILGAGGAEHFVLVFPDSKTIERWSLRTFEKEASEEIPVPFKVDVVALGSGSHGPLFLWGETKDSALVDVATLKKLPVQFDGLITGRVSPHELHIEAAADGSAFTTWFRRQHAEEPPKFRLLRIEAGRPNLKLGLSVMKPCFASVDGGPVVTGEGNVYTSEMQPVTARQFRDATLLPVGTSYLVAARWEGEEKKARIDIYFMNSLKPAFPIGEIEELDQLPTDLTDPAPFSYDRRIQFVPTENVLLTLPATNDRIVIRKFDVDAALKKSGADYLFVSSSPVRQAMKGMSYAYQIDVRSNHNDIRMDLESGPKGMTLSQDGRLTWDVPSDGKDAAVIVSIRDKSSQKVFHSFNITVK